MRAMSGLPSLRSSRVFPSVKRAITRPSRYAFRVLHYSVQQDHLHLIVEADTPEALRSGVQGLAIRTALAVNRTLRRRGDVWADRYHARALKTPREVRASLFYVLFNFRKHLRTTAPIDPCSSGHPETPVAEPATWLARVGWVRAG
jgi:hypothetical protein